jgi:hypothetical protein
MEIKTHLDELIADLEYYDSIEDSRDTCSKVAKDIIKKYKDSEFDFDVLDIINAIIKKKNDNIDILENKFINKYLSIEGLSRYEILNWIEKTSITPGYLSNNTLVRLSELRKKAEVIVSEGKIDDVIHYFMKLRNDEMEDCIKKLIEISNKK